MSEKEHTRTSFGLALGKVYHYSNTKILLLAGLLIDPLKITTTDAGDILLRIGYSAESHEPVTYYCGEE
jgi:hypothetical protein